MFFKTFAVLLALAGAVAPYPSNVKRADDEIKIYAYGSGISGLQVYGGTDGKAYIADSPGANLTELVWQPPSADAPWNVSFSNQTSNPAKFYIITTTDANEPAGFQRDNDTAPTGAAMMGFTKYGSQIMWLNGTSWESKFWASSTEVDGLWKLNWNVNNANVANSVPVTIKTLAPNEKKA